jgi:peptidoglycan biosynthesis protein MviN/MurJ (putative lipid II flippase)
MKNKYFYFNFAASIFLGIFLILQDSILAKHLGISAAQDAFQIAYLIVTTLWNAISGGAYISVVVPVYMLCLNKTNAEQSLAVINQLFTNCLLFVLLITAIIFIFSTPIYKLFLHNANNAMQASILLKITILSLPIQLLSSHIIAILYCKNKNYLGVVSAILVPLATCLIGSLYALSKNQAAYLVLIGCIFQLGFLLLIMFKIKSPVLAKSADYAFKNSIQTKFYTDFFQVAISLLLLAATNWLLMIFALRLSEGAAASFAYALKPIWLIGAFLTTITSSFLLTKYASSHTHLSQKILNQHLAKDFGLMLAFSFFIISCWLMINTIFYHYLFLNSQLTLNEQATIISINKLAIFQLPIYMCGIIAFRVLNGLRKNSWITIATTLSFLTTLGLLATNLSSTLNGLAIISLLTTGIWGLLLVAAVYIHSNRTRLTH